MRSLIRSRKVALPLAALALTGTGVAAYGAASDDAGRYRTVEATTGDVEQQLSLSGVISPAGRSDLSFGTDGEIAKVRVEQGDQVEQGDVIAVLDRSGLRAAVDAATSELANAKAQLAEDRDAQASAVTAATDASSAESGSSDATGSDSSGRGAGGAPTGSTGGTSSATTKLLAQLTTQQEAVLAAQTAASTALSAATAALAAQQQACADPAVVTTDGAADAGSESAEGAADEGTADEGTAEEGGTTSTAVLSEECTTALATVQSAQASAAEGQTALQGALTTLGATLTTALGTLQGAAGDPADSGSSGSSDSSGTPAAGSAAMPSTSGSEAAEGAPRTVTAATLAQDQAAIDKATAELAAARAELRAAVVRAPADGTVVSLAVGVDDDVSAGDTIATLVAPGLTTVAVAVSATQAARLEVGTAVQVTPAGATDTLAGKVGRVDHVASSSTTGSDPTYPVEIVLDDRDLALADGMTATVTVVVGSAEDVVVLPASAVTDGTVTVLDDEGQPQRVRVTTGVVGATTVEIVDGVDDGAEVVLADLDAELPTGDTEQQGPGGFSGGFNGGLSGGFNSGGGRTGGGMMVPR